MKILIKYRYETSRVNHNAKGLKDEEEPVGDVFMEYIALKASRMPTNTKVPYSHERGKLDDLVIIRITAYKIGLCSDDKYKYTIG